MLGIIGTQQKSITYNRIVPANPTCYAILGTEPSWMVVSERATNLVIAHGHAGNGGAVERNFADFAIEWNWRKVGKLGIACCLFVPFWCHLQWADRDLQGT